MNNTKKLVLITGASGLLGRAVYKAFVNDNNWKVVGLAFSRAKDELVKVDLTSQKEVSEIISNLKPSFVIHSAAERRPDVVESLQEHTYQVNIQATKYVCQEAAKIGAPVLYMSTDYVFDGTRPPHKEIYEPHPLNKYGESKLEGEQVTMETSQSNMILRVPILYGDVESLDESAVTILFPKVQDNSTQCVMSAYERRYPTYTDDVAEVIRQLIEKRDKDNSLTGIFQWSGDENMTKYDMAIAMAAVFELPTDHIKADTSPTTGAKRPYDAHLDSERLEKLGIWSRRPFKQGIESCLHRFVKEKLT